MDPDQNARLTESHEPVKPRAMSMLPRNLLRFLFTLFTLTAVVGFAGPLLAQTKFAIVDVKRSITETEDGLRARATLKKFFQKRQTELSTAEKALGKERQKIEKERSSLNRQDYEKRLEKFQRDAVKLQQQLLQYQQELAKKESELLDRIHKGIMAVIRKIATKKNYDMVVDRSAVAYMRTGLDITDQVISEYNKKKSGKE